MSRYPLASTTWDEEEYAAINKVIASGLFTMGESVAAFERAFASFLGVRFCVMVNSGSSANLLMVAALFHKRHDPLRKGDEVIVPAVSWGTTYYPLYQYGLKLKFVDIDIETLNYDLDQLSSAVGPGTRMVVAVNILGNPNDFNALTGILRGRNILLIEDNCESLGASYQGKQAGTFGLMGSFSTFFSHHISTMEGGIVATNDEEMYQLLLSLRAHGWTRNLPEQNLICGRKSEDSFEEAFRFVLPGYNLRPLEISGAIGVEQLKKLPQLVANRRQNAAEFRKIMQNYPVFQIQREIGNSSWFGFSIIVREDAPFSRERVLRRLREKQIEFRPIVAGNILNHDVVKWFDHTVHNKIVNADIVAKNGLYVGNHHYHLQAEFDALAAALDEVNSGC